MSETGVRIDFIGGTWYVRARRGPVDCMQRLPGDPAKWADAFAKAERKALISANTLTPYAYGGVRCGMAGKP